MTLAQQKRCILVLSLVIGIGSAVALILYALSQNINLFYTPTQIVEEKVIVSKNIRVGGMVVKNSLIRRDDLAVEFLIQDFKNQIKIYYEGILPDLFREGQGIVALGKLTPEGQFRASQVLAKHDEKYMPPEVATALKLTATKYNAASVKNDT